MPRDNDYISEVRVLNRTLWETVHALKAKQAEWNAKDYGTTLADGTGFNEGYNKEKVGAVVFATTDGILGLFAAGNATNLANLL
jgi:hypothetical protein